MPGYNHYPDCTCGWCQKTSSSSYTRPTQSMRGTPLNAPALLAAYRVSETRSAACFVNPNAFCPVCGEQVYFYQNTYGSKVYFDDVGWPWPKHPCTDNGQSSGGEGNAARAPARFPNELRDSYTSENLLQAARDMNIAFRRTQRGNSWKLGVIVKVGVFEGKTDAYVSFLEESRPVSQFRYEGISPFLAPNSIIAYKDDLVSLPDAKSLEPTKFKVRWIR